MDNPESIVTSHLFQKRLFPYLKRVAPDCGYCYVKDIYIAGISVKKFVSACESFKRSNPEVILEYNTESSNTITKLKYKVGG